VLRSASSLAGAWGSALLAGLAALTGGTTARAQDWSTVVLPDATPFRVETWAGADITSKSWSAYSGVTLALFGPIDSDGWRLRAVGGYGTYSYGVTRSISGPSSPQASRGTVSFADILLGYQQHYGPLTLKAFAGVSAAHHPRTQWDGEDAVSDLDYGFKGILEAWLNMTERSWASLNLAWSPAHDIRQRLRFGFAIWPDLSLGVEAEAAGNAEDDGGRGGAFVRYRWARGEIAASGGPSLDSSRATGAYGTLNVLTRF
jgi:hypothetical protein